MENCPVTRDLQLKMVIFHSHTSLPEGTIDRVLSFKALAVCFDYPDVGQSHIPKRRRKRHEIFRGRPAVLSTCVKLQYLQHNPQKRIQSARNTELCFLGFDFFVFYHREYS